MRNELRYIDWRKAPHVRVDYQEWNELLDKYEEAGCSIPVSVGNKTMSMVRQDDYAYNLSKRSNSISLFCCEDCQPTVFYSMFDENKSELGSSKTGKDAIKEIRTEFLKIYGQSMTTAFGTSNNFKFHRCVKSCRRSMWINNMGRGRILKGLCKADISSCYPYELSKALPTLVDAKIEKGVVLPTEEYPFTFLLVSGHIIIHDELDTRALMGDNFYLDMVRTKDPNKIYWTMPGEEEISVCCKKCALSMKPIMEKFYKNKQTMTGREKEDMKRILVASIGYLESEDFNKYSNQQFLSAVVYARTLVRMIGLAHKIEEAGGIPLMMLIDSLIWKGPVIDDCVDKKSASLGDFVLEFENVDGCYLGQGQYALADKSGSLLTVKHQGIDKQVVNSWKMDSLQDFLDRKKEVTEQAWVLNNQNRFIKKKEV